jgi:gas vesicle protein GvpG
MGLLSKILFFPISGPVAGIRWSLGKVVQVAEEELTDDTAVKEDLLALQMELEVGAIDDDEYVRREAALMERLRDVRAWRERLGKGTSGGPVQVASPSAEVSFGDEPAVETGETERDGEA